MSVRTVVVSDPFARANVVDALSGNGAPVGVRACTVEDQTVTVTFEEPTSAELIDDLIAIELTFVAEHGAIPADLATAAAGASRGLSEPALSAARIIETYLA
jgi:hypothetical protein